MFLAVIAGVVETPHPHVEMSPKLRAHVVAGTRVPVRRLWSWHQKGVPVAVLIKRYPSIAPAKILDSLSWCHDNTAIIEQELEEERACLR